MRAKIAPLVFLAGCASAYADTDNELETYTQCVLTKLLESNDETRETRGWEVIVLDEDELALHVLPGHKLALDAALLRFSSSSDELAAAIAHELGHAIARHGWDDDHGLTQEREASRIAVSLASAAGFSPEDGVGFWRRVASERESVFVRLHPEPEENAHVLQDNLRDAEKRYRSAIARGTGPTCEKPNLGSPREELRYAAVSAD
jgi:predicted Zn-dependent protease